MVIQVFLVVNPIDHTQTFWDNVLQHIFGSGELGYYWVYYSQGVCVYIDIYLCVCVVKTTITKIMITIIKKENKDNNDDDNNNKNLG